MLAHNCAIMGLFVALSVCAFSSVSSARLAERSITIARGDECKFKTWQAALQAAQQAYKRSWEAWQVPLAEKDQLDKVIESAKRRQIGAEAEVTNSRAASRAEEVTFDQAWKQKDISTFAALASLEDAVTKMGQSIEPQRGTLSCYRTSKHDLAAYKLASFEDEEQNTSHHLKGHLADCRNRLEADLRSVNPKALTDYEQNERSFVEAHPAAYNALLKKTARFLELDDAHIVQVWARFVTALLPIKAAIAFGCGCQTLGTCWTGSQSQSIVSQLDSTGAERISDPEEHKEYLELKVIVDRALSGLQATEGMCKDEAQARSQYEECYFDADAPDDAPTLGWAKAWADAGFPEGACSEGGWCH